MMNEFDFDSLARKANESGGAMEALNELFGAAYALPKWHFIARGELPNINPYIASNAGYADGQQMIRAFTDTHRLQRFAKENNLTDADGSVQMLDVPFDGVIDYLEQFIEHGIHGIWFNSDTGSDGFFIPLTQLRPIKEHLEKLNSLKPESPLSNNPPQPPASQPKTIRPECPTKSAAFWMLMSVALLLIGIPIGVMAYQTYQDYSRASNFTQYLRDNPNALPDSQRTHNEIIAANQSSADRFRHNAILSGAGSLIFLCGATLLFIRGRKVLLKEKTAKMNYEPLDWRAIPKPKSRINVRFTRMQDVLLGFLIVLFGGMSLLLTLNSRGQSRNLIVAFFCLAILFVICYLVFKAKKFMVRFFDASGIGRGDRRQFSWSEFRGVMIRTAHTRYGRNYVWRIELAFSNGEEAWIIPQRIKNFDEVYAYVDTLPRAILKES